MVTVCFHPKCSKNLQQVFPLQFPSSSCRLGTSGCAGSFIAWQTCWHYNRVEPPAFPSCDAHRRILFAEKKWEHIHIFMRSTLGCCARWTKWPPPSVFAHGVPFPSMNPNLNISQNSVIHQKSLSWITYLCRDLTSRTKLSRFNSKTSVYLDFLRKHPR